MTATNGGAIRAHITRDGEVVPHAPQCRCDACGWLWPEWATEDHLLTLCIPTRTGGSDGSI